MPQNSGSLRGSAESNFHELPSAGAPSSEPGSKSKGVARYATDSRTAGVHIHSIRLVNCRLQRLPDRAKPSTRAKLGRSGRLDTTAGAGAGREFAQASPNGVVEVSGSRSRSYAASQRGSPSLATGA